MKPPVRTTRVYELFVGKQPTVGAGLPTTSSYYPDSDSGYAITLNYAILHCIEIRDDIL